MNKQATNRRRRAAILSSWSAAALAAALLTGCGTATVSRGVNDEGVAQEVVFPQIKDSATLPEGTFPNLDNLRAVGAGQSKDQLYDLLGRPHFQEGMLGVREWDYIFNFRVGGDITTCQYKVIFDKNYLARSFHWQPANCGAVLAGQAAPAPMAATPGRTFSFTADALFAFDGGAVADLKAEGRQQIQRLAGELQGKDVQRVEVVGHADRLGAPDYNLRLSRQRAQSVRAVLVQAGVPADRIEASGRGESEPVVQCSRSPRDGLIACLAPNRRVDVRVAGRQPS